MSVSIVAPVRDSARDALVDDIATAITERRRVRIAGAGTWIDAGRPVDSDGVVSTRTLTGIVEYVPGDLTLTARAGTTLAEIADATAAAGQWLAMDPHGSDAGTLGATVATASAGPLASAFGTPRDLVLGLEFISGTGAVVRGGGRVVKNVAGFDLVRLLTGSWGTLGVLTEISVRLHARPQADESFAVPLDSDDLDPLTRLLRRLPFTFYACEVVNAALAASLGIGNHVAALVRIGGNAELVSAARTALRELGVPTSMDPIVWRRLRASDLADSSVFRLSHRPTHLARCWAGAITACGEGGYVHATPARGIVRCMLRDRSRAESALTRIQDAVEGVTIIGERLPASAWRHLASPLSGRLPLGIKQAFDPGHLLNRGILGDE